MDLDARAEAFAHSLEDLAYVRGLELHDLRDLARVELRAVAHADDVTLRQCELGQRAQKGRPLSSGVDLAFRRRVLLLDLRQLAGAGELRPPAAVSPSGSIDRDAGHPGREASVGSRRVAVERSEHGQHRVLSDV